MGFALDFGSGFFQKMNQVQDENRQEATNQRRFMMQTWATTTLPQVQKQREVDNQSLSLMNQYAALDDFKDQPELAFYAAKSVTSGQYRNVNEFLDNYTKNPDAVPPAIKMAQREALGKTFNYTVDESTGKLSNFTFKDQPPARMQPLPGANQKRGIGDILMGRTTPGQNVQQARENFSSATGIDPAMGTSSRFDNAPMSGTLNVQAKDKQAERYKELGLESIARNPDMLRTAGDFYSALMSGDQKKINEVTSKKGFMLSKEEMDNNQFTKNFKLQAATMALSGEFKDSTGVLSAIVTGKGNLGEILSKNLRTPEEKAKVESDLAIIKQAVGSLDSPEAYKMMRAAGVLNKLNISPDQFKAMDAVADKLITDKQNAMNMYMRQNLPGMGGSAVPGAGQALPPGPVQPQQAAPTAAPEVPAEAAPAPQDPDVPEGAFGIDDEYVDPTKKAELTPRSTRTARVGENLAGNPIVNIKVNDAVTNGDEATINQSNPFAVMRAVKNRSAKAKDPRKAVEALRFSKEDINKLKSDQFTGDEITGIKDFIPKYQSMEEATSKVPVGGIAQVKGYYIIMTQEIKDKANQQ